MEREIKQIKDVLEKDYGEFFTTGPTVKSSSASTGLTFPDHLAGSRSEFSFFRTPPYFLKLILYDFFLIMKTLSSLSSPMKDRFLIKFFYSNSNLYTDPDFIREKM